jgi:hypothetical protein
MTIQNRTTLAGYFNTGDQPSEANFTDLVSSIPARHANYVVAAVDAEDRIKNLADAECDGTADDVEIQGALTALPAGGGEVALVGPNFTIADTLTMPVKSRLFGQGHATKVSGVAGMTATLIQLALYTKLDRMWIALPNGLTDEAIKAHDIENTSAPHGFSMCDLTITGGNAADKYAISIANSFNSFLQNIVISTGTNGVKIASTSGLWNYGNGLFNMVEVSIPANRIAWDIMGIANVKNYNLMQFNYISAISGSSDGNIGIRIQNCAFMSFINADIEGVGVGIEIQGGVNGGAAARSNIFMNPYVNPSTITIGAGARCTTFIGGRLYGAITDSCETVNQTTMYYGTSGADGTRIAG